MLIGGAVTLFFLFMRGDENDDVKGDNGRRSFQSFNVEEKVASACYFLVLNVGIWVNELLNVSCKCVIHFFFIIKKCLF